MVAPDIDVTVELARALLAEQHPDLADLPIRIAANGWDNTVLRLGADLALRLPRREAAAELIRHEQRWLPVLAPALPAGVPVPVPVRRGAPSAAHGYPWAWSVLRWIDGTRVADVPVRERRHLAEPLAAFHRALHRPAPGEAPRNPVRGVPLATRAEAFRARLVRNHGGDAARLRALFDASAAAPMWDRAPVWLHGDPHPGNLLATRDGGLAVIDFGDLAAGDPATDLAVAWLAFDAHGRATYRAALAEVHPTEDPVWHRAYGWALNVATAMLDSTDGDAWIRRMGERALHELLTAD
ncbi:aminoglycoside phosphotransferase family protein [Microbacterium sp. NPDC096154]|uniref:aminoglycoside phosphotransferase family protein n=1 Tax=Microbacterium sp. NPDC096154 TaxID=3155549 RepID=UPI003330330B